MVNKSNIRKLMWIHPDFIATLKKIKAMRLLNSNGKLEEISIPDLTKELIKCKNFASIEKELTKEKMKEILKIKLDRRLE